MRNFCETCTTAGKRAQLLGNVHNISDTCTASLKSAHIEYLKTLGGGGETRHAQWTITNPTPGSTTPQTTNQKGYTKIAHLFMCSLSFFMCIHQGSSRLIYPSNLYMEGGRVLGLTQLWKAILV